MRLASLLVVIPDLIRDPCLNARDSQGFPDSAFIHRHAPMPVWPLSRNATIGPWPIALSPEPLRVRLGKTGGHSVAHQCCCATKRPPVRCSCPEYLRRGHPAFAPGCCPLVALRSFRLGAPGSPLNQEAKTQLPVGPELGAHRPHGLPMSVRSGTDRYPDARSAHPFPAQRYLQGGW